MPTANDMGSPIMFKPLSLGFLLLCVAAGPAQAQRIYKCTDAKGRVYITQTPPPECLGRPTDVLDRKGSVIQHDEGQLSETEQARRAAEAKKKADEAAAAKEERRKATALLNTYSSEKDVDDARARAIKENETAIRDAEKKVGDALKRQKELDGEKEFYAKKTLPAKLQQDIKANEYDLKSQQELLESKKKQVIAINAKYDEDKKRYVDLTRNVQKH